MISSHTLNIVLTTFVKYDLSVLGFISALLTQIDHPVKQGLLCDIEDMMVVLHDHPALRTKVQKWSQNMMTTIYQDQFMTQVFDEIGSVT